MACFFCKVFPYVLYLNDVQCCSFAFDKYVFLESEMGVKCRPKYLTLVHVLINSPMTFIVLWIYFVKLLSAPKIDEFSLCLI